MAQRKTEPRPKLATSATQVSEPETETTALAVQEPVNGAATVTSVGRLLLFNCQDGIYRTHDDGAELPDGTEFIAHADSAIHGWIRFDPDGGPVTSVVGGYFDPEWKLPQRSTLGEMDKTAWRIGKSGKEEDPWKQTVSIPLEATASGAFFTLSGNTPTTVNGLYRFLNEYRLLRRRTPGALPVIRLATGSYKSKYGSIVHKPILVTVSRASVGEIPPPVTAIGTTLDDKLLFAPEGRA